MANAKSKALKSKSLVMAGSMTAKHLGSVLKGFGKNRLTGHSIVNHGYVRRAEGKLGQTDRAPAEKTIEEGRRK